MRRHRVTALLAGVFATTLIVGVPAVAVADPGPYEVVGSVLDESGDPVVGVTVYVNSANPGPDGQYGSDTTDESGEFTVGGFTTDTLSVGVSSFDPDWPYFPETVNVTVGPSTPSARADLTLRALPANDATLTGTVTLAGAPTPTPIVNARVSVNVYLDGASITRTARTDDDGVYVLTLPSSSVDYRTAMIDGPLSWESGYTVAYTTKQVGFKALPGSTTTRNVQLTPAPVGEHSISGTVVRSDSAGFGYGSAGIQPWPYGASQNVSIDTGTGAFLFEGLLPGTYRVSLFVEGAQTRELRVVVDGDEEMGEITLTAFQTGTGSVAGTLTDLRTGLGLPGATVNLSPYAGVLAQGSMVTTDGDGVFAFDELPDGRYWLSVSTYGLVAPSGAIGYREYFASREVVVDGGDATAGVALDLTSVLPGTSVLEGRARDAVTHLPLAGARVIVSYPSPSLESVEGVTDAQGRFTIPGLIEGPASVGIVADGYLEKWVTVDLQGESTAVVVPVQRSTAPVSTFHDGTVTATVLDLNGDPVDDAKVIVTSYDLSSDYWQSYTDGDGVAEVTDLEDGVWKVYAEDIFFSSNGRVFDVAGIELTGDDRDATVTVHQVVPGTITGHVDIGDFSADGLYVTLFDDRGIFVNQADIEADGSYVLSNVTPGSYRLRLGTSPVTSGGYVEGSGDRDEIGAAFVWWTGVPDGDGNEQSPDAEDAALLEVGAGDTLADRDFAAVAGATVRAGDTLLTAAGAVDLPAGRCFTLTAYRHVGSSWVIDPAGYDSACGTEPLVARGLAAGQYKFAISDEYSGSTAFRTVFNGGAASLAAASPVTLVAGESVDLGVLPVSVPRPEDATLEAIDLDALSDSGLYEDQIGVEGDDAQAGEESEIEVGAEFAGQWVNVSLNSTPIVVGATWHQVAADGTVTVTLPSEVDGSHRLAVGDATGQLIGWTAIEIAEGTSTGGSTGGTGGTGGSAGGGATAPKPSTGIGKVPVAAGPAAPATTPTASPTPTSVASDEPEAAPVDEAEPAQTASDVPSGDLGWLPWAIGGGLVVLVAAAGVLIFVRRAA